MCDLFKGQMSSDLQTYDFTSNTVFPSRVKLAQKNPDFLGDIRIWIRCMHHLKVGILRYRKHQKIQTIFYHFPLPYSVPLQYIYIADVFYSVQAAKSQ